MGKVSVAWLSAVVEVLVQGVGLKEFVKSSRVRFFLHRGVLHVSLLAACS
jgi:hypothetical protein